MRHIPARISPAQRAVLEGAGPVGAAARGLLWLGMAAAGLPLPPETRREILGLLAEDLAPSLLEQLQELADQLRDGQPAVVVPAVVVTAAPPSSAPTTAATTPATSTPSAAIPTPEPAPPPEPAPRPHTRAELEQQVREADDPYGDMGFEFDG